MHTTRCCALVVVCILGIVTANEARAGEPPPEVVDLFSARMDRTVGSAVAGRPVDPDEEPDAADADEPPLGIGVSPDAFHPSVAESARSFLNVFTAYARSIDAEVARATASVKGKLGYDKASSIRKRTVARHRDTYRRAMALASAHIADFQEKLGPSVDRSKVSLAVSKSSFVVRLMAGGSGRALAVFPIAYGIHPDRGQKTGMGDLRTPESPEGERSPATTPFFAGPLVADDPAPDNGCVSRGIGVSSNDSRFGFLEGGWTVMLHGTPDRGCMGTRASHGCIRMLPEHIEVLFDYVSEGTPIVITP